MPTEEDHMWDWIWWRVLDEWNACERTSWREDSGATNYTHVQKMFSSLYSITKLKCTISIS